MSPLDRIVRAVHRRGIPAWVFFLVGFALLSLGIMVGLWTDGTVPFPELHPRALDRIQPVLDTSVDLEAARRWLTSMPLWQFLGSLLVGMAIGGGLLLWVPAYTANVVSPTIGNLIFGIVGFLTSYGVAVATSWQCLRIIAAVVWLHRRVPSVDLFRPAPAHAFAPVTAGAGLYLTVNMAFNGVSNPATLSDVATVLFIVAAVVTATAAFVLPLVAMRGVCSRPSAPSPTTTRCMRSRRWPRSTPPSTRGSTSGSGASRARSTPSPPVGRRSAAPRRSRGRPASPAASRRRCSPRSRSG